MEYEERWMIDRFWKEGHAFCRLVYNFGMTQLDFRKIRKRKPYTIADTFEGIVSEYPQRLALIALAGKCQHQTEFSFKFNELNSTMNKIAYWGLQQGFQPGHVVCLFMTNRAEFLMTWLGLAKIGVTTALINHHINGPSLVHCLVSSKAKTVIFGPELYGEVANVFSDQQLQECRFWQYRGTSNAVVQPSMLFKYYDLDINLDFHDGSINPDPKIRLPVKLTDPIVYIYTSGTTGFPKPCVVSHKKVYYYLRVFSRFGRMTTEDRAYVILPMYHNNGGTLPLSVWMNGGTLVIKDKFSASNFWDDCRKYNITCFPYVGEICRYLHNKPSLKTDSENPVRLVFGAGMRADIWEDFQTRFQIPDILEFYGATEANAGLLNVNSRRGACGHLPFLAPSVVPFRLVKYDVETDRHIKNEKTGFLIECQSGEIGEGIARINDDPGALVGNFEGYTDGRATKKKILRDVFETGDAWFRSGDLLVRDRWNYFYFVDRIGDTFRWKGENVSTSEVEQIISCAVEWIDEVTVYGVTVPRHEGRAGMASVVIKQGMKLSAESLSELSHVVSSNLAKYARPVFLRIHNGELITTSTFKHHKATLRKEGYDPSKVGTDALYVWDSSRGCFTKLSREILARISVAKYEL
eukprot:TRINITY_DN2991_c0_g1_i2.p1 TRINITY_DN2991_c0_g1~~TRINITY_DN2991_c0_g1_i2.p1  ORF type:complete len:683 (+),score=94.51 TRINITY_DN2991_c0_g1_i2:142-2049(+)